MSRVLPLFFLPALVAGGARGFEPGAPGATPTATEIVIGHGHNPVPPRRRTGGQRSVPVLFVDATAPEGGNGESWPTAYRDLQQALADAANDSGVIEIRVAAGVYRPDAGTGDRSAEFLLVGQSNLSLLGGFPEGGSTPEQRDPVRYETVLSGDLLGDDVVSFEALMFDEDLVPLNAATAGVSFAQISDNSQTVIGASGTDGSVLIDGFTVTGGHDPERGGGLIAGFAGLTMRDLVFRGNSAGIDGGAVFLISAQPGLTLEGCRFERNAAVAGGGAITTQYGTIALASCSFVENRAQTGGGAFVFGEDSSRFILTDCSFVRNVARGSGGGAAISRYNTLDRCVFEANASASHGGGVWLDRFNEVNDCTFAGNIAGGNGGGGYIAYRNDLAGCTFQANQSGGDGGGGKFDNSNVLIETRFCGNSSWNDGGGAWFDSANDLFGCVMSENIANRNGGAVRFWRYNEAHDGVIRGNSAAENGGGAWADIGGIFANCVIEDNHAGLKGGGAFLGGTHTITRSRFAGNSAGDAGGGVALAGGTSLDTCTLTANDAAVRGGAASVSASGTAFRASTVQGNHAGEIGGVHGSSVVTVIDSVLWDNTQLSPGAERAQLGGAFHSVSHSIIMGLSDYFGNSNSGADPQFVDPVGPDGTPGTGDEDLRPGSGSPAIDTGSYAGVYSDSGPFDILGRARFAGFGGSIVRQIDRGAYEAQDCDGDGLIDSDSIALGDAEDCNGDGIPDLCQAGSMSQFRVRKVVSDDIHSEDGFGLSTAVDGGVVAIGTRFDTDNGLGAGSAYLMDAATGAQLFKLLASDGVAEDYFGNAIDIKDGLVIVGAYHDDNPGNENGSAYLFLGSTGQQYAKLSAPGAMPGDYFGISVAIGGGRAIAGAHGADGVVDGCGAVFVFHSLLGTFQRKLQALDGQGGDWFGISVDTDAGLIVVGAERDDDNGNDSGSAYIFDAATGAQLFKLLPDDGAPNEYFGRAVAIGNGLVAVGAELDDDGGTDTGSVYLFDAATGIQLAKIRPGDAAPHDHFGSEVDLDGGLLAVGAELDGDSGDSSGSVYLYDAATRALIIRLAPDDLGENDHFGAAVAVGRDILVGGAYNANAAGNKSGTAYFYTPLLADGDGDGVPDDCHCPADFNADGVLDFFDLQSFLNAFAALDPSGDINGDEFFDFFDLQAYLNAFAVGCP